MSAQYDNPTGGPSPAAPDKKRRSISKASRPLHSAPGTSRQRAHDRIPYDTIAEVILEVQHPGGTISNYLVQPRNLSAGGMSLNHGGFIAPRTTCFVRLITLDGMEVRVEGRVLGCRCVGGRLHDVGVSFNEEIDLGQFVNQADDRRDDPADELDHVESLGVYHKQKLISISRELCGMAIQDAPLAELREKLAEITALLTPSQETDLTRE